MKGDMGNECVQCVVLSLHCDGVAAPHMPLEFLDGLDAGCRAEAITKLLLLLIGITFRSMILDDSEVSVHLSFGGDGARGKPVCGIMPFIV